MWDTSANEAVASERGLFFCVPNSSNYFLRWLDSVCLDEVFGAKIPIQFVNDWWPRGLAGPVVVVGQSEDRVRQGLGEQGGNWDGKILPALPLLLLIQS